VMDLLQSVCAERSVTLVTVLHDESLAARYADRRYCLRAGRLVQQTGVGDAFPLTPLPVAPASGRPSDSAVRCCAARASGQLCCCHEGEGPGHSPAGPGVASLRTPAWMKPGSLLVIGLLVVAAYAWSAASLGLHETGGRSVLTGLARFGRDLVPTSWAQVAAIPWATLLGSLLETVQMSLLGTTAGVALAYPLAALAARNTGPGFVRPVVRQLLNAIRTVPSLIWALLFVAAVGFGELAGVLALSLYSVGYLTKFFYESFENTARGPQEALREIGASGPQRFVRVIAPASRPAIIAAVLFMMEHNVRSASVLGVVDAGGIGYYIRFYLEMRAFPAALACLVLIFVVVVVLDAISQRVRRRLIPE
jgi:phosphonate transport system permease protein